MAKKFTFDELLAKRERREADRLKIGMLTVPGNEYGLEARMPSQKTVLDLYGELVEASDAKESLLCGNHAVYACCPQLWDKKLQEALGCQDDPMRVLDELFDLAELDLLGGQMGTVTGKILTGSMDAYNDFDTPNTVSIQSMEGITVENGQARFTLPACSVVEITLA